MPIRIRQRPVVESDDSEGSVGSGRSRRRHAKVKNRFNRARTLTLLKRAALTAVALLSVLLIAVAIMAANTLSRLNESTPSLERLLQARSAEPSVLLSASGTHLATYSRGHFSRVRLDQISQHVVQALIATEDHRFYSHEGVDFGRTLGAAWYTLQGRAQGGSTITQQLVRNLFPKDIGRARTLERKLREMMTARKIEKAYTKDEILETYLNTVPFLYHVIGIEMAARTYFDKPAAELSLLESATLVGMLKGTSFYNPVLHPARAQQRRNVVLAQMVRHQMLPGADFERLREQPLQVQLTRQPDPLGSAPHFAAHLQRQLMAWAEENDYNIYADGLIVHSTIDDSLQQLAEGAVARQTEVLQNIADVEWAQRDNRLAARDPAAYARLRKKIEPFSQFWAERADLLDAFVRESPEYRRAVKGGEAEAAAFERLTGDQAFLDRLRTYKTRLEAGFVALDPRSGEIKAWIGSRDFARDQFDHVAQAARQPGSTFKPFVYGAAMEVGLQPELLYPDGQVEIPLADGGTWRPTDMAGFSGRMMTMREGLVFSKNTITAQVMQDVGLQHVVDLARAVGIRRSRLHAVPSLSLGTSPITLLEMVAGYSTIAQTGEYREPLAIRRITDRDGKVLAEFRAEPERAMSEETAVELIDMMRAVLRQGTGVEIRNRFKIDADIAGKTGTTQNNTDGWFILMHPDLVTGAWVGFNDQRVTMRSDYWGQGGHNAVLLVGDFMRDTLKARLIDRAARFPQSRRPPPLMVRGPISDEARIVRGIDLVPEPGYGMVTQEGSDTMLVITPDGIQRVERSASLLGESVVERRPPVTTHAPGDGSLASGASSGASTASGAGAVPGRAPIAGSEVPVRPTIRNRSPETWNGEIPFQGSAR